MFVALALWKRQQFGQTVMASALSTQPTVRQTYVALALSSLENIGIIKWQVFCNEFIAFTS